MQHKRAYRGLPAREEEEIRYVITSVRRNQAAIERAERLLGWRIYLTNAPVAVLTLAEAVSTSPKLTRFFMIK